MRNTEWINLLLEICCNLKYHLISHAGELSCLICQGMSYHMRCVARFGITCTVLKKWKTPMEKCYF